MSVTSERTTHRVEGLRVQARDGDTVFVERVDLELAPGEIVGVVGETGAGKTLTMRGLLGVLPSGFAAAGTLQLAGEAPVQLGHAREVRAQLGRSVTCVLQNPLSMLDPLRRIGSELVDGVVHAGLMSKQEGHARARDLLTRMGFDDADEVMKLYPHQLSGGMAQRVAIAMGLMPKPRLVVLDEPTSALDAHTRLHVLELFQQAAREEGATVLLVSHDLGLVQRFCDQLLVMYAGLVVEAGPSDALVEAPQHPYTQALLECSATLEAAPREHMRSIPGTPPTPTARPSGCPFRTRCPVAFERCEQERPALGANPGSRAACHLAPGLAEEATRAAAAGQEDVHAAG